MDGGRTDPCVVKGYKAVSDGYWIMLKPLAPGVHTLIFSGTEVFPTYTYTVTVTYNLTVE